MKRTRVLMLGLGLALFAAAMSAEPAVAQFVPSTGLSGCWDCTDGPGDDERASCYYCSAMDIGMGNTDCATPECHDCWLPGDWCLVFLVLDGRVAPVERRQVVLADAGAGRAIPTVSTVHKPFASSSKGQWVDATVTRSCDGGIISKSYSAVEVLVARGATARLRL